MKSNWPELPLNEVWKVGSRWSETGYASSSILDIFRNHNVVFVGNGTGTFRNIKIGDLIVISDGYRIVALGPVIGAPAPLPDLGIDFTLEEKERFDCEDSVWGCRIDYVDISGGDEEPEEYRRRGACHAIHERANEFRDIYLNYRMRFEEENQFEIGARSCTLISNSKKADEVLWRENLRFQVPIYQRPYSWEESQIRKLVTDLLGGFYGRNGGRPGEPVFIGTMQLSAKLPYDGSPGLWLHEVIDGQQRLSTIIMLLKILQDRSETPEMLSSFDLCKQLETRVSSGEQQQYWLEALGIDSTRPIPESRNRYLRGMSVIIRALEEDSATDGEKDDSDQPWTKTFRFAEFANYLSTRVYFVVIETRATLSKTLTIFDAINTAGMDLNGGDVFKIRYYEYLRKMEKAPESMFQDIDGIYQLIDKENRSLARTNPAYDVVDILTLAQQVLIPRFGLPLQLHDLAGSTFFERLFDTILDVNRWPGFSPVDSKTVRMSVPEFRVMVDAGFEWEREILSLGAEARCALLFMETSRYGRYWFLPILFRFRFGNDKEATEHFVIQLSKLLVLLSIWKKKALYEGHVLMKMLLAHLFGPEALKSSEEVIDFLHREAIARKGDIEWTLRNATIAENAKAKNLACRVSAMMSELEQEGKSPETLSKLIFETDIDIEHIESVNHQDEGMREIVWQTWGDDLHRIGNLMMLEYDINRSLQNKPYALKRQRYGDSTFSVARTQGVVAVWSFEAFKARHDEQVGKIVNYLCSPAVP